MNSSILDSSFICPNSNNSRRIEDEHVCNGFNDCVDSMSSDECNCSTTLKNVCLNGRCILDSNICDEVDDCQDGETSDEKNCSGTMKNQKYDICDEVE